MTTTTKYQKTSVAGNAISNAAPRAIEGEAGYSLNQKWLMNNSPTVRILCTTILVLTSSLVSIAQAGHVPVVFDMGTSNSPVAESSIRITGDTAYRPDAGYGWVSSRQTAFDRDQPLAEMKHRGNPMRPDLLYHRHATPMTRDGVSSMHDLRFRVDVPSGQYRVQVWLGDLHHALESIAVECNGKTMATGLSAKHLIGRNKPEATGMPLPLRFDAEAADGFVELRFYGDETAWQRDIARYNEAFPQGKRPGSYLGNTWKPHTLLKFDPKGPFTRNSVLAIRISSAAERLFEFDSGGKLSALAAGQEAFVTAFNEGDFLRAESLLDNSTTSSADRLQGYLALLGHPGVEGLDESRVLASSRKLADELRDSATADVVVQESVESLDRFVKARSRFLNRGHAEEGHFQENRKAVSQFRTIQRDDLLYYKSLVYQGRALQMLDPHRWVYASGDAQRVWQELISIFPHNRYAKYYLTDEWAQDRVWTRGFYKSPQSDAPDWAIAQREAWHSLLDICEYWADNKQQADGGIGGGWGDDVELVYLFGMMAFISEGSSDKSIRLAERLIDGLWKYGGMDQDAGFYRGVLDAEHSAEWTGDTLPLMLLLKWDNPVWHERAMKTASLMRNLWMGYNDLGDFHFRNNFLGSIAVGNEQQANDSFINFRATIPALSAFKYNRNPHVAELFVEWADAWLNDAMRTDRDKPRGIFPAEIGFPEGTPGGVDSPSWYRAAHPPGTVNYDWDGGHYTFYLVDLMLLAHEITGDDKYLEPFRLQRQLVDQYRAQKPDDPVPGTPMWAAKILSEGGGRQRRPFDEYWPRLQRAIDSTSVPESPVLTDRQQVLSRMTHVAEQTKRMWPVLTTETSASDRVGFRGIPDPFLVMTGASGSDLKPSVSYAGTGREFAAFVKHADERELTTVLYNFAETNVDAALIPWKLAVGASYLVRTGLDTDGDDIMDEVNWEEPFDLVRRGQRIPFLLPAGRTTLVEIRQTTQGQAAELLADLAIVPEEIEYSIWTRDLSVTVHNIGSRAVRDVRVTFYETDEDSTDDPARRGRRVGEAVISYLSWPMDLCAKTQTVAIPYIPTKPSTLLTVVVDESESVDELSETNNRATRLLKLSLDDVRAPRNRLGEVGGDVSDEIRRGIR